jgi:hypothetical protein
VEDVLLGLERLVPDRLGEGAALLLDGLDDDEPMKRMKAAAGRPPLVLAVPGEGRPQALGRPPAVREAEAREDAAGEGRPERLDELLPEEPERDGVEEERALAAEMDEPALRVEAQELPEIEVFGAHRPLRSK